MDTIWIFFSFVSGTGIGFIVHEFIAPVINHKLAQSRDIKSVQVSNFIKQYNTFQDTILPTIQSLTKPGFSLIQILNTDFPKHELAMMAFVDVLKKIDSHRHSRFIKTWTEYKEIHQQGEQYEEFENIEFALSLINDPAFIERMSKKDIDKLNRFKNKIFTLDSINKKYVHSLLSNLLEIANKY